MEKGNLDIEEGITSSWALNQIDFQFKPQWLGVHEKYIIKQ
jgi:hypothetical protein